MRKLWICLFLISGLIKLSIAQDYSSVEPYLKECDNAFSSYLLLLSENDRKKWGEKYNDQIIEYIKISDSLDKRKVIYPGYPELYSYKFLNVTYLFQLNGKTFITNDLGQYILSKEVEKRKFDSLFSSIEKKLNEYRNTRDAETFFPEKISLEQLRSRFRKNLVPPLMKQYIYIERTEPYSDISRFKQDTFKLYNWKSTFDSVSTIYTLLLNTEANINQKDYLVIKDPNSPLVFIIQIIAFIALIPSFIVTYSIPHKKKYVFFAVIFTLVCSIILVIINPNTLVNILTTISFPAIFYIYYLFNIKKWKYNNPEGS